VALACKVVAMRPDAGVVHRESESAEEEGIVKKQEAGCRCGGRQK
jgi:hypothetical protein